MAALSSPIKWGRGTARLRGGGGNDGKAVSVNGDIVWLRDDFRLDDQPAILAAADRPALHVYVQDDAPRNGRPLGGADRVVHRGGDVEDGRTQVDPGGPSRHEGKEHFR